MLGLQRRGQLRTPNAGMHTFQRVIPCFKSRMWWLLGRYGKVVPEEIKKLVQDCWEPQPDNRPSFEQISKQLQALFDAMPAEKKKKCSVM